MKKTCLYASLVVLFAIVAIMAAGCHGLGETSVERSQDHARQQRLEGQMLIDDIDAIFQTDRTSRLSEYTVR